MGFYVQIKAIWIMKTMAIYSLFILFAIVSVMGTTTTSAFADHSEVTIETADNYLSSPGCLETDVGCYTPNEAIVDFGGVVIMTNTDETGMHTFTAGTLDGFIGTPSEIFDTGILNSGDSYEWTADVVGEIPYYCTLHTWMQGLIIVQEIETDEHDEDHDADHDGDETLMVTITDSVVNGKTLINLEFSELHVNYEIIITQNGEEIYKETSHTMVHETSHMIDAIGSDDSPISIEIVSLGIGPIGNDHDWTGPTGTIAVTQIVPEFGAITMMILAVAIISIIAVTAKSRVIPRF